MAKIPVICDSCNTLFVAENIISGYVRGLTMVGNKVGPCPSCGGVGHIPDGVYDLIDDTLKLLRGSAKSVDEIERFQKFLEEAQKSGATHKEVLNEAKSQFPDFAPLLEFLKPKSIGDFLGYIGIILTILSMLKSQPMVVNNIDVQQVINNITAINKIDPSLSAGDEDLPSDAGKRIKPREKH